MRFSHLSRYQSPTSSLSSKKAKKTSTFYQLFLQASFKDAFSSFRGRKSLKSRHISTEASTLPFQAKTKLFSIPSSQLYSNKKSCKK